MHCSHDLVKDLLTILVEHHTTFVLRVRRILHNIDVGVIFQFTFLFAGLFFTRISPVVPKCGVVFGDGILLTQSGQGVLDVPTARTLEGVFVQFHPGEIFTLWCRKETHNGVTIARLVHLRLPQTVITT